jgi:hypothetical protein
MSHHQKESGENVLPGMTCTFVCLFVHGSVIPILLILILIFPLFLSSFTSLFNELYLVILLSSHTWIVSLTSFLSQSLKNISQMLCVLLPLENLLWGKLPDYAISRVNSNPGVPCVSGEDVINELMAVRLVGSPLEL